MEDNLKPTAQYLLGDLGISKAKLASYPNLLTYSVEDNLKPTVQYLLGDLGFSKAKLASFSNLLSLSVEENLKPTAQYLLEDLGISKAKLASCPTLLTCSVEKNIKPKCEWIRRIIPDVDFNSVSASTLTYSLKRMQANYRCLSTKNNASITVGMLCRRRPEISSEKNTCA